MAPDQSSRPTPRRRVSHAALVCFAIAAISFVASALGFFVNQALTGSLAISGTAAVGLIYLAMGLLNLGHEADVVEVIVSTSADARIEKPVPERRSGTNSTPDVEVQGARETEAVSPPPGPAPSSTAPPTLA